MIKKIKVSILAMILALGIVGCGKDNEVVEKDLPKIGLVLSTGGINDQSFNQSAWEDGALKAKEELGVEVTYLESHSDADYIQNIETAVEDNDLVIGVGFQLGDAIKEAAKVYPDKQFVTIDSENSNLDNVRAITFDEEEAGYLTGLIAGKTTKTNVIGWIGGMDIPSCSNFYVGYEKGAKEVNPNIKVLKQFTNSFSDAAKGKVVAQQMINENADIIFTASGGGNVGSLEAIKENNIYAINVDMPGNYLAPQHVLTSALKNVGEGLRMTIEDYVNGEWTGGEVRYNYSNNGVGFEKTDLLSDDLIKYVEDKLNK